WTFDSEIEHLHGQEGAVTGTSRFADVPVSSNSKASLTIDPATVASTMALDVNADGTSDFTIQPNQPVPPQVGVAVLINVVESLGLPASTISGLLASLSAAQTDLMSGSAAAAQADLASFLNQLNGAGGGVPSDQAARLMQITSTVTPKLVNCATSADG